MLRYGDTVRFRGDPDEQEFRVLMKNHDGSLEIENGSSHFDWIPERLLEKVAPKLEPGQVWEDPDGDVAFVTRVDGGDVSYVGTWDTTLNHLPQKTFRIYYKLVHSYQISKD